jgi:hypothetical protein
MRWIPALVLLSAQLSACRRPAPQLSPEPAAPPLATQGGGPDAAAPSAPNTPGPRGLNLCASDEPEVDRSTALGLQPRVVTQGAQRDFAYPTATVFLRAQRAPLPPSTTSGAIQLELTGPATRRRNEPLRLQLSFRNTAASAATVISSNDGSFEHMREPFIDLYAEDLSTGVVYRSSFVGGRCGMVNQLQARDLVAIPARSGSAAPVESWANHLADSVIPVAGRYRLWAVYRMCSFAQAQGMGTSSVAAPPELFVGRASSNAIELTVR